MQTIRVLLVDDHALLRLGLRALLSDADDIEVVGEAGDGQEALEQVRRLHPDVVLLDVAMPKMNGLMVVRQLHEEYPDIKVVMLTQYDNPEYVVPLLQAGAAGYVLKQDADIDLVGVVRSVYRGDSYLAPQAAKILLDAYTSMGPADPINLLTPREREVLILVAQGYTNREIANILHLSPKTVDVHRTRMMDKLDLHNVADVTRYAIRRRLVDPHHQ